MTKSFSSSTLLSTYGEALTVFDSLRGTSSTLEALAILLGVRQTVDLFVFFDYIDSLLTFVFTVNYD